MSAESGPLTILIVGGGIAGYACAIALQKTGRKTIVLEQSRTNQEIGATISLQPNASKIVEKQWGLREKLVKTGAMLDEEFRVYGIDGTLQRRVSLVTEKDYGADRMVYVRADLHTTLKNRAISGDFPGDPAEVRLAAQVRSCNPEEGTVTLAGGEVLKGDLIVGADGIKSTVREFIVGEKVKTRPTGHSAYRLVVNTSELKADTDFYNIVKPHESATTMIVGFDRRIIMGPARNGQLYSVVAMVPDASKDEDANNAWTTEGGLQQLLQEYKMFPEWSKAPFKHCDRIGLWQLRDIEPLPTWHKGCAIIVGDAAHAMLPTQGQGASQSIEDAEALGAFFSDIDGKPSTEKILERLKLVFEARYDRATLIQSYSRLSAQSATSAGSSEVKMNPTEFMDYNCSYDGAREWLKMRQSTAGAAVQGQ